MIIFLTKRHYNKITTPEKKLEKLKLVSSSNLKDLETIAQEDSKNQVPVNNVDLLRRISQLEKIVYGKDE